MVTHGFLFIYVVNKLLYLKAYSVYGRWIWVVPLPLEVFLLLLDIELFFLLFCNALLGFS